MTHSQRQTIGWLIAIVVSFFFLDCYSLHTGDDLGYMFADTTHHCGDGEQVTSLAQCFTTQAHHYVTTNGRFAVHVVVMALLNLLPLWMFRALNALMFGAMCYLATRFVAAERRTNTLYAVAWLLLFVALPQPGVVLLTLVAYAVNYLWVGVAVLSFLLWLRRNPDSSWLIVYAFFVGTLQESYSLPLCAGLFVAMLCRRVPIAVTCAFIAGTAVEVFAPGNMSHASQGGGFALSAIANKASALGTDLLASVITYAALAAVVWFFARRKQCISFFNQHLIFAVSIVAALGLAVLTFTSPRQLTAPSLFTIILLLQFVPTRRWLTVAATAVVAAVTVAMGVCKYQIHVRYQSFVHSVAAGLPFGFPQGEPVCTQNNVITRSFIPDPLCNRALVTVGDKYTKLGLQRLRATKPLVTILPYAPEYISAHVQSQVYRCGDTVNVSACRLGAFSAAAIPKQIYHTHKITPRTSYEMISHGDTVYAIFPKQTNLIKLELKQ
jgi:hypothetical protein